MLEESIKELEQEEEERKKEENTAASETPEVRAVNCVLILNSHFALQNFHRLSIISYAISVVILSLTHLPTFEL